MEYRRCGNSGLQLPALSLGLWHNFGANDDHLDARQMLRDAFDAGITHFDLANNYGPPPGSAETVFGRLFRQDFGDLRDELVISTKAGHLMWPGPYGDGGSRKHLLASLEQSLKRMKLDYVDIFYTHRPDPDTPLEETIGAVATAVEQGKALYAGISKYEGQATAEAVRILRERHIPVVIHQHIYNLLNRWPEQTQLSQTIDDTRLGCICFSPLAQGMLTEKYLDRIPSESRAARDDGFLTTDQVMNNVEKIRALAEIAKERGEPLNTMALAWVLQRPQVTSALIGARTPQQLAGNLEALNSPAFSDDQLQRIDAITGASGGQAQAG
ncbi:aldo/keto reductase [Sulfuriroseicoccus oceanibius]|uniref:Aldo/keto reductase n=2 Tax=Sulfuriroseicoccus oceanibius TaxID=2707525 RepID=A0A7T7F4F8_9BACT|nr:aldo/keto reductase [Sulfuriroseicoccus oceanibius]